MRRGRAQRRPLHRRGPLDGPGAGARRAAPLVAIREIADGARDALRLATGMTYKAAAAGLDLGGGKGVICAPPEGLRGERRRAALLDFGDLVESLDGRYMTAEDVGIGPADLVVIRERTSHLTGLPTEKGGTGDPSPFTAIGVEAAIRACVWARFGDRDLRGRTVSVVGLGPRRRGAREAARRGGLPAARLGHRRRAAAARPAAWRHLG